jgi:hypothetical protein
MSAARDGSYQELEEGTTLPPDLLPPVGEPGSNR